MYFFVWCWGYNCGAYKRKFTVYTGAQQLNSMTSSLRGRRSEVKGARKNGRARETREGEGAPAREAHPSSLACVSRAPRSFLRPFTSKRLLRRGKEAFCFDEKNQLAIRAEPRCLTVL